MNEYKKHNRSKYYLKIHLILVCKYRKKLLLNEIKNDIHKILLCISEESDFEIVKMESDQNHIHLLISYIPRISVSSIVNRLKSKSTIEIWKKHNISLSKQLWKENTFWSDGFFACSVGEASSKTIENYILNQG
jgi:putative transposase